MSSENNGGFGGGFIIGVIATIIVGYFVLNTNNPLHDAANEKAFQMSIDHVKTKLFGR